MSTKESVKAAAAAGSAEVTPHHLFLSREQFRPGDTIGKVNPPLRSEKERKALWTAWDKISVIASDHAPHTPAEKQVPFHGAPSGIPGVETMVPLLLGAVLEKKISLPDMNPEDLAGTCRTAGNNVGRVRNGGPGGFCIVPERIRADRSRYPAQQVRLLALCRPSCGIPANHRPWRHGCLRRRGVRHQITGLVCRERVLSVMTFRATSPCSFPNTHHAGRRCCWCRDSASIGPRVID